MIRSRIAPTPSGYLHIGNAMNFVQTWLMVRKAGGKLRLRIDDVDAPRAKVEYVEDIFRTLEWMGMDWDEGPQSVEEQQQVFSQSLRGERYGAIIKKLIDTGRVFACVCSRREVDSCRCSVKNLSLDTPDSALRIMTPEEAIPVNDKISGVQKVYLNEEMKDFVIQRRDGIAAYQVASLADDLDFKINLIIRGEDLLPSTAAQLYLAKLIGDEVFRQVEFHHHPLIADNDGYKLSKSAGSFSLKSMRERDGPADKLYLELSKLMGLKQPCVSLAEMLELTRRE